MTSQEALSFIPEFNEGEVINLLKRIKRLKENGLIKQKAIVNKLKESGLPLSESRFSEILKDPAVQYRSIKQTHYNVLHQYLIDNHSVFQHDRRIEVQDVPDALYYALLNVCKSHGPLEEDVKSRLEGRYILYRPSVIIPKKIIIALVEISYDPKTNVVSFNELTKIQKSINVLQGSERQYAYSGYILRTPTKYFGFQIDNGTGFPRISILNEVYEAHGKITQLSGVTMGTLGTATYVSNIYLERWLDDDSKTEDIFDAKLSENDEKLKKMLLIGMHDIEDINLVARSYLEGRVGDSMALHGLKTVD